MSRASSIRELSGEQLEHELRGAQESLFRLRLQAASERNDVPTNSKKLRRRIAQIMTVRRERELG